MIRLNNSWQFIYEWSDDFMKEFIDGEEVRLPHTVRETPLHYPDPSDYSTVCGYRRYIDLPREVIGSRIFLKFEGAAHIAGIYINHTPVGTHRCGYTAFTLDISDYVHAGKNQIAVKLDCRENPDIPPFGGTPGHLTYGGLYRDVWLDIRPETYIEDVFVYAKDENNIHVDITCCGQPMLKDIDIYSPNGNLAASVKDCSDSEDIYIPHPMLWSVEHPNIYKCVVTIKHEDAIDTFETGFGIRLCEFRGDAFYLNRKPVFLRGLNRHQCFPYIGDAAPEHLQREDARILKEELGVNAVRTVGAPPSRYFIDECDRLGILVFMEMPGSRYIGDDTWKEQALVNLREMILQNRNHPSVILWGVRICDSTDDDEFYLKTNALAGGLDPSRQTGGARFLKKGHLLEDVYTYDDYSHDGTNLGCLPKEKVLTDRFKPYLISAHNGQMFPAKAFDDRQKLTEQALRHARVIDAAMSNGNISGCLGWCMSDYPSHREYGSGDRICYHGVTDMFRNPKSAAYTYASFRDDPVFHLASSFESGDNPGGKRGIMYAFTNADEIKLYKDDVFVNSFYPGGWDSLPHGPIEINDTIGSLLAEKEGFAPGKAAAVKKLLLAIDRYGIHHITPLIRLRLFLIKKRYRLSFADIVELYNRYVSDISEEPAVWRIDTIKGGEVAGSYVFSRSAMLHIEAKASAINLTEGSCYDMALVRIRIVDENGNTASFDQEPLILTAEGTVSIVGPQVVTAEGGMCGTLVRTNGQSGSGSLSIYTESGMKTSIGFSVRI